MNENILWKSRLQSTVEASLRTMPALMGRWLKARGFLTQEQADGFLSPSLSTMAHPSTLRDMEKAVARLVEARGKQENVCVYGDYDLDGSSGIALLVDGLKGLGFQNVSFYQPSRFLEGYGIHADALETISKRGDKIVISVDCGITAIEEARKACELGLDLIITDHHLPRGGDQPQLPECVAVINPNRGDCTSQLSHLSGVGVGYYLLLGLKAALKETSFDFKSLLDLFAIGTVADMVPLRGENRVLVKHGLKLLVRTKRLGLRALLQRLELTDRELDSTDIAFSIAPKLNALSRLELGIRPLDIFMCEDAQTAQVLAEKVVELNTRRKQLQQELEDRIMEQLQPELQKPVIVLAAAGHAGVVGLVATKVSQISGKPAFIVAWHEGAGTGSARGDEAYCLPMGLAAAGACLERFGGHAQAAGFSLKPEKFEALKAALEAYYAQFSSQGKVKEHVYDVDAELSEINGNFMAWLKHAGPFGMDNPAPLFKVTALIKRVQWLKEQHLKLTLARTVDDVEALAFFARGVFQANAGERVDLLVEPSWNYWRGQRRLQLLIRDLKINKSNGTLEN